MTPGKLYRICSETALPDLETRRLHHFKVNDVVIFVEYKLDYPKNPSTTNPLHLIHARFVVNDVSAWFLVGRITHSDRARLPTDILETKYIIPFLEKARPSSDFSSSS